MMRRGFWVSAVRVYLVVSGGSLASPSLRGEEVEALSPDGLHERTAAAGKDDDAVIGIRGNRVK